MTFKSYSAFLQAIYVLFRDDGAMKLPYCIAIAGFVCALFAFGTPHLSALRIWLGFSTFFSLVYIVTALVLSLRDGMFHSQIMHKLHSLASSLVYRLLNHLIESL